MLAEDVKLSLKEKRELGRVDSFNARKQAVWNQQNEEPPLLLNLRKRYDRMRVFFEVEDEIAIEEQLKNGREIRGRGEKRLDEYLICNL